MKDAFHDYVVDGRRDAVNPAERGTKAAARYRVKIPAGGEVVLRMRLASLDGSIAGAAADPALASSFDAVIAARRADADEFYALRAPKGLSEEHARVQRQAYAGLLFTKQFYALQRAGVARGRPRPASVARGPQDGAQRRLAPPLQP